MNGTKSLFQSKTFYGAAVAVAAGVAGLFGFTVTADDQAQLVSFGDELLVILGGLLAIYGRATAKTKIS